jgi:hypothetical protein
MKSLWLMKTLENRRHFRTFGLPFLPRPAYKSLFMMCATNLLMVSCCSGALLVVVKFPFIMVKLVHIRHLASLTILIASAVLVSRTLDLPFSFWTLDTSTRPRRVCALHSNCSAPATVRNPLIVGILSGDSDDGATTQIESCDKLQ